MTHSAPSLDLALDVEEVTDAVAVDDDGAVEAPSSTEADGSGAARVDDGAGGRGADGGASGAGPVDSPGAAATTSSSSGRDDAGSEWRRAGRPWTLGEDDPDEPYPVDRAPFDDSSEDVEPTAGGDAGQPNDDGAHRGDRSATGDDPGDADEAAPSAGRARGGWGAHTDGWD